MEFTLNGSPRTYDGDLDLSLLKYLRDNAEASDKLQFCIPYTRQQIADMTGLRVETVIRTVKKLQREGKLEIRQHKIYLN